MKKWIPTSEKNLKFREILNRPGITPVPMCYDAISAKIAERAGAEILCMGGNGTMASLIGWPDMGLATGTEMYGRAAQISSRINIPLYCDSDTGYGNLNNVRRTVREYEKAGASGIHLEDQTTPKRCGMIPGLSVISAEEAAEKIKVAAKTRQDPNFIIVARTDCHPPASIDEVIRRCKMFADAGADAVIPLNLFCDIDNTKKFMKVFDGFPVVADVIEFSHPIYTDKELEEMGFKIVTRGLSTIFGVSKFLKDWYESLLKNGSTKPYFEKGLMTPIRDYEDILDIQDEHNIREMLDD
jgi:2-methylisocitrate lyase-like PEP mutase family enzyme